MQGFSKNGEGSEPRLLGVGGQPRPLADVARDADLYLTVARSLLSGVLPVVGYEAGDAQYVNIEDVFSMKRLAADALDTARDPQTATDGPQAHAGPTAL